MQDEPAYSPIWSCSGRGLPCRELLPVARCALTAPFHPYRPRPAVYFLWHFPWAHAPQALPGALSEGARTFLCHPKSDSDCLVHSGISGREFYRKTLIVGALLAAQPGYCEHGSKQGTALTHGSLRCALLPSNRPPVRCRSPTLTSPRPQPRANQHAPLQQFDRIGSGISRNPVNSFGKPLDSGVLVCEALRERSEQRTNEYPEVGGCVAQADGRAASSAPMATPLSAPACARRSSFSSLP